MMQLCLSLAESRWSPESTKIAPVYPGKKLAAPVLYLLHFWDVYPTYIKRYNQCQLLGHNGDIKSRQLWSYCNEPQKRERRLRIGSLTKRLLVLASIPRITWRSNSRVISRCLRPIKVKLFFGLSMCLTFCLIQGFITDVNRKIVNFLFHLTRNFL